MRFSASTTTFRPVPLPKTQKGRQRNCDLPHSRKQAGDSVLYLQRHRWERYRTKMRPQKEQANIWDVLHARFFFCKYFVVIVFKKKSQNVATLQSHQKRPWSQTKSWKFNAPQKRLRKHSLPSEKKRDGPFLPNKLTANNSSNR